MTMRSDPKKKSTHDQQGSKSVWLTQGKPGEGEKKLILLRFWTMRRQQQRRQNTLSERHEAAAKSVC
jgi:hypothetical protein